MANLIITIISIALVAVAAIMGVYYGGTAYQTASAKAKATAIVEAAGQVAAAWRVYAVNHGGTSSVTLPGAGATCSDMYSAFTPAYLASAPALPRLGTDAFHCFTLYNDAGAPGGNFGAGSTCCDSRGQHYHAYSQRGLLFLWTGGDGEVCRQIVKIARGPDAVMGSSGSGAWDPSGIPAGGATFDCYYWDYPDVYAFFYKVWN